MSILARKKKLKYSHRHDLSPSRTTSHLTTSTQSLARWGPLRTRIRIRTLMNTSHTHWHGRCWPQVPPPRPLHLLMRGQRLRETAESVRPWLHTSWDTHTGQTKQPSLHSSPVSPALCAWDASWLPYFVLAHTFTHKHTPTPPERALTHFTVRSVSLSAGLNGPTSHFSVSLFSLCGHYKLPLARTHTHTVNMSDSRATSSLIPRQSLTNDDGTKTYFSGAFWSVSASVHTEVHHIPEGILIHLL